jgi:rare lipoprotein A
MRLHSEVRSIRSRRRSGALSIGLGAILLLTCVAAAAAEQTRKKPHIDASGRPQHGVASYVTPRIAGRKTASGDRFAPGEMTAASRTLPLGAKAKVTNTENGKSVHVTVNDRGPFVKGRILDVSPKAASRLGMKEDGVSSVKVQPIEIPKDPPDGKTGPHPDPKPSPDHRGRHD